jgi:hypothetical protein
MDITALGHELAAGADLLSAPSMPERIKEDGLLPLLLALRAAARISASGMRKSAR